MPGAAEDVQLAAWMAAHRFDFAGFICADDQPPQPAVERPARQAPPPQKAARPAGQTAPAAKTEEEPVLAEVVEEANPAPVE